MPSETTDRRFVPPIVDAPAEARPDTSRTQNASDLLAGIDQDQPFDLYETPGHMVRRLHQIVVSLCSDQWADLNLNTVQYGALLAVRRHPGIDQRSLALVIALDRSTTGTVVEALEKRGLIFRQTSQRDRRNKELFITEAGAGLMRKAHPIAWEIQDRLLQPLDKRDRETFVRLLKTLVDANNDLSRAPLDPNRIPPRQQKKL